MITPIYNNLQVKNINFTAKQKVCNIFKCKAYCCMNAPLPLDLLEIHKKDIVNPVLEISPIGKVKGEFFGIPITNLTDFLNNKCPFLTQTNKCNIYENRPQLCREYGTLDIKTCHCDLQE